MNSENNFQKEYQKARQLEFAFAIPSIEEVLPKHFNKEALRLLPYRLKRFNFGSKRFYYYFTEEAELVLLPSVTTVCSMTMPKGSWYAGYILKHGSEEAAKAYMNERADAGSFLHICIEDFLINGFINLEKDDSSFYLKFLDYAKTVNRGEAFVLKHIGEIKKDLLSFAQFCYDHELVPLAIELTLKSEQLGTVGTLDLYAEITWRGKRRRVIIDFKIGKKGFFPNHAAQLHILKELFLENFPGEEVYMVINWAGSDWRKAPASKHKDQTKSIEAKCFKHYTAIANLQNGDIGSKYLPPVIDGEIRLGEPVDACYYRLTVGEYLWEKEQELGGLPVLPNHKAEAFLEEVANPQTSLFNGTE